MAPRSGKGVAVGRRRRKATKRVWRGWGRSKEQEQRQRQQHEQQHQDDDQEHQPPADDAGPPPLKKRAPLPSAPRTGSGVAARRGSSLLGNVAAAEAMATSGFTAVNAPATLPASLPAAATQMPGEGAVAVGRPPAADPSSSEVLAQQQQHHQHHHHLHHHHLPPHHPSEPSPARTGAQVVVAAYGSAVRIDSVLCKRLASEPARRDPVQRRADQRLNIERRSNVEALLAHVTGQVAAKPCKNCHKGHGPWTSCVVYDGQMCGSCSNCWFNASGAHCTFHENNLQPPPPPLKGQPFVPACPSPPAPPTASHSASTPPTANGIDLQYFLNDIAQVRMPDATRRAIFRGLHRSINMSVRERYYARIEATAEELVRRIAELDQYRRTPEGILAEQTACAQAQALQPHQPLPPSLCRKSRRRQFLHQLLPGPHRPLPRPPHLACWAAVLLLLMLNIFLCHRLSNTGCP